jgi:hypothetical protein
MGHGYSFEYPRDWRMKRGLRFCSESDYEKLSGVLVAPGPPPNGVGVGVIRYPMVVNESNIDELRERIIAETQASCEAVGGRLTTEPTRVTLGGMPGFRFEASFQMGDVDVRSRVTLAYHDSTQYGVNAQFTLEAAETILRGADQVEESFRIG